MNVTLLLLALAAGYAVLVVSNKQEKPLDTLGRIIGGLILIVSFAGLLFSAICLARYGCPYGSASSCPMVSK
jgi:hypothetical protein